MAKEKPMRRRGFWVVVCNGSRSRWFYHTSVSSTRKGAITAFLKGTDAVWSYYEKKGFEVVKVTLEEGWTSPNQ